jgi:hypothetical protein
LYSITDHETALSNYIDKIYIVILLLIKTIVD